MRLLDRQLLRVGATFHLVAVTILAVALGAATRAPQAGAGAPAGPGRSGNFTLPAANGYTLYFVKERGVLAITASRTQPLRPTIDANGGIGAPRADHPSSSESIYTTPEADGRPGVINADLGPIGSVALVFHPSGRKKVTTVDLEPGSEDCAGPTKIVRRLGTFEGSVVFHAENGYTSAAATSVPGSVGTSPLRNCAKASNDQPGEPAEATDTEALLSVSGAVGFYASRTAHGSTFHALSSEQLAPNVSVGRIAASSAPNASFWFAGDGSGARVRPPAPFSGSATYRSSAGSPSWSGDLSVDFPGITQPLTGEGLLPARLKIYPLGRG